MKNENVFTPSIETRTHVSISGTSYTKVRSIWNTTAQLSTFTVNRIVAKTKKKPYLKKTLFRRSSYASHIWHTTLFRTDEAHDQLLSLDIYHNDLILHMLKYHKLSFNSNNFKYMKMNGRKILGKYIQKFRDPVTFDLYTENETK